MRMLLDCSAKLRCASESDCRPNSFHALQCLLDVEKKRCAQLQRDLDRRIEAYERRIQSLHSSPAVCQQLVHVSDEHGPGVSSSASNRPAVHERNSPIDTDALIEVRSAWHLLLLFITCVPDPDSIGRRASAHCLRAKAAAYRSINGCNNKVISVRK